MRSDFPLLSKVTYLDTASSGALSRQTHRAVSDFMNRWLEDGEDWDLVLRSVVDARRLFAEMIGVHEREVALVPNASTGLVALASSLKLNGEGNVVAANHNFPTNLNLWASLRRSGAVRDVRLVSYGGGEILVEEYERLVDDETVLVSVDMVGWLSGYREDLKTVSEIAHDHGALLISDIFHAAGVIPLNLKKLGVDAAVCGSYKWLLAPSGAGFLYVDSKVMDEALTPRFLGWMGVRDSVVERMMRGEERLFERPLPMMEAEPADAASRYEWGTWSGPSVVGLSESLRYLTRLGDEWRWSRVRRLTEDFREGLEEIGASLYSPKESGRSAGIVSVKIRDSYRATEKLSQEKIIVSARPKLIRFSIHFYNNEEDVERVLNSLKRMRDNM